MIMIIISGLIFNKDFFAGIAFKYCGLQQFFVSSPSVYSVLLCIGRECVSYCEHRDCIDMYRVVRSCEYEDEGINKWHPYSRLILHTHFTVHVHVSVYRIVYNATFISSIRHMRYMRYIHNRTEQAIDRARQHLT